MKMSDEEIEKVYNEMVIMFGDNLPNPEHYPKGFAHYVNLWKFYTSRKPTIEENENV